jgi:hypothetical protein
MVPDELELLASYNGISMKLEENFTNFIRVNEYNWFLKIVSVLCISNTLKNLHCDL